MPLEPVLTPKRLVSGGDSSGLAVVKLQCFAPGEGPAIGFATGVFLEKDLLLTVGHALYEPLLFGVDRDGGFAGRIRIASPWFPVPPHAVETDRIDVMDGWFASRSEESDIGLVRLNTPVPGATTLAPRVLAGGELRQTPLRFYGFPADSSQLHCGDGDCVETMAGLILHTADAGPGESGSPLLGGLARPAVPGRPPSGRHGRRLGCASGGGQRRQDHQRCEELDRRPEGPIMIIRSLGMRTVETRQAAGPGPCFSHQAQPVAASQGDDDQDPEAPAATSDQSEEAGSGAAPAGTEPDADLRTFGGGACINPPVGEDRNVGGLVGVLLPHVIGAGVDALTRRAGGGGSRPSAGPLHGPAARIYR